MSIYLAQKVIAGLRGPAGHDYGQGESAVETYKAAFNTFRPLRQSLQFLQGTQTYCLLAVFGNSNLFFNLQIYGSTLKGTDTTSASILLNFEDEVLGEDYFTTW
jgi:hypothetical protein